MHMCMQLCWQLEATCQEWKSIVATLRTLFAHRKHTPSALQVPYSKCNPLNCG